MGRNIRIVVLVNKIAAGSIVRIAKERSTNSEGYWAGHSCSGFDVSDVASSRRLDDNDGCFTPAYIKLPLAPFDIGNCSSLCETWNSYAISKTAFL